MLFPSPLGNMVIMIVLPTVQYYIYTHWWCFDLYHRKDTIYIIKINYALHCLNVKPKYDLWTTMSFLILDKETHPTAYKFKDDSVPGSLLRLLFNHMKFS